MNYDKIEKIRTAAKTLLEACRAYDSEFVSGLAPSEYESTVRVIGRDLESADVICDRLRQSLEFRTKRNLALSKLTPEERAILGFWDQPV